MNNKFLGLILGSMFITTILALFLVIANDSKLVSGSTFPGAEYISTTTDATWTTLQPKVLKSVSGSLGSVVITTVGTGSFTLYDATTTNINLRTGNTATSTLVLANFQITTSLWTYVFDEVFKQGLIAVWTGTNNASTTVTFR